MWLRAAVFCLRDKNSHIVDQHGDQTMELDTTHLILRGLGVLGVLEGWSDSEIKTRHASAFKDCAGRTLPLEDASRGDVFFILPASRAAALGFSVLSS